MTENKSAGRKLLRILDQKGQDIVEYAVILAFCALVGYSAHSMGFISIMSDTYNNKASNDFNSSDIEEKKTTIAGNLDSVTNVEGAPEAVDWGRLSPGDYNESNKLSRLESDQIALGNIAELFLGKTKKFIQDNYTGLNQGNRNSVLLGWFRKGADGSMYFTPSQLKASNAENIFRWLQGDFGENGYSTSFDSSYRYLVSDYVTKNFENPTHAATGGNGLRMRLEYDSVTKEVSSVTIALDPLSQNDKNGSGGLQVTVTKDGRTITKGGL